ncbi:MAG TPA: YitT family protein, partial [Anaeromyxobacteraceae bacterium]|nr:YitT family protein [Anaeromyxobacteraceae bacterium]
GVRQMGWRFTLKTFAAIGLVSLGADSLGRVVRFAELAPAYAAVMGGLLVGVGLLILFRHGASLGGLNILAIWLQERRVVRAGTFQMAVDSLIVVASFFVVTPLALALSVLGAVAMNLVLAVNHRPGRYLGA